MGRPAKNLEAKNKEVITIRQVRTPTLVSPQFEEFDKKLQEIEKQEEGEDTPVDQNTEIALAFIAHRRGRSSDTIAKALNLDKKIISNYLSRARQAVKLYQEIEKIMPPEELKRLM